MKKIILLLAVIAVIPIVGTSQEYFKNYLATKTYALDIRNGSYFGVMTAKSGTSDVWCLGTAAAAPGASESCLLEWNPTYISADSQLVLLKVSSTTIATLVPKDVGAIVYNTTRQAVCVGTDTVAGAWIFQSTNPIITAGVSCKE